MIFWLWIGWLAVFLVGVVHLLFFYAETVTDKAEQRLRPKFRNDNLIQDPMVPVLFQNQGVYNLLLGLGILWRLIAVSAEQIPHDTTLLYLLSFVVLVGVFGLITVRDRLFLVQF